jgi:hypothetical protein
MKNNENWIDEFLGVMKNNCNISVEHLKMMSDIYYKLFFEYEDYDYDDSNLADKQLYNELGISTGVVAKIVAEHYEDIKGKEDKLVEVIKQSLHEFDNIDFEHPSEQDIKSIVELSEKFYNKVIE